MALSAQVTTQQMLDPSVINRLIQNKGHINTLYESGLKAVRADTLEEVGTWIEARALFNQEVPLLEPDDRETYSVRVTRVVRGDKKVVEHFPVSIPRGWSRDVHMFLLGWGKHIPPLRPIRRAISAIIKDASPGEYTDRPLFQLYHDAMDIFEGKARFGAERFWRACNAIGIQLPRILCRDEDRIHRGMQDRLIYNLIRVLE